MVSQTFCISPNELRILSPQSVSFIGGDQGCRKLLDSKEYLPYPLEGGLINDYVNDYRQGPDHPEAGTAPASQRGARTESRSRQAAGWAARGTARYTDRFDRRFQRITCKKRNAPADDQTDQ